MVKKNLIPFCLPAMALGFMVSFFQSNTQELDVVKLMFIFFRLHDTLMVIMMIISYTYRIRCLVVVFVLFKYKNNKTMG